MKTHLWIVLSMAFVVVLVGRVHADEVPPGAVLDKAIKALGGEAKLSKAAAFSRKIKGTMSFGGNDNEFTSESIMQGLDRYQSVFEGDFGGNKFKGVTVLNGEKGWRKFGDNKSEMDKDALANETRTVYLQVVPSTLLPLKGKAFKVESAGEEKVGDKPAVVLKVTGPDAKEFTLFFDKDSALLVKLVAKVRDFQGQEFTQESIYSDYKDFDGIKQATQIQLKRDGEIFLKQELTDFKILEKIDPKAFAEPE
jgi:hypothetical protein